MSKVTSDGSTASYYELPEGAQELQHLISYRNMNGQLAEIFRACYRYGIVSHSDQLRDAKKMVFYAMAEVERLEKWSKIDGFQHHEATPNVLEFDEARADAIGQNGNDGLHYTEDMTDPRNWRAWDWVEFIYDGCEAFTKGNLYRVRETTTALGGLGIVLDDFGSTTNGIGHKFFRFHARPDADGWIKWDGGECPVGGDVEVEVRTKNGGEDFASASAFGWGFRGSDYAIIAYRPHLATKHDKG